MTVRKTRLTVTVDPELIEEGNQAVEAGEAESLSAWVNKALTAYSRKQQLLRAGRRAVAEYEAEFGVITEGDLERRKRRDRANAIVVRGRGSLPSARRSSRKPA